MVKHKGYTQRSQPTIRKSTTTAVAMEVDPPPAPHAAKRPVKKTHKKHEHCGEPKAQSKTKELNIYTALRVAGVECDHKKPIKFRRRGYEKGIFPDTVITTHWGVIVLQVDAHQHASYPAEFDLRRDFNTFVSIARTGEQRVAILRYNPDEFHLDGINVQIETEARHRRLVEVLRAWMAPDWVPTRPFERFFLYYDSESGANLPRIAADWGSDEARVISAVVPIHADQGLGSGLVRSAGS